MSEITRYQITLYGNAIQHPHGEFVLAKDHDQAVEQHCSRHAQYVEIQAAEVRRLAELIRQLDTAVRRAKEECDSKDEEIGKLREEIKRLQEATGCGPDAEPPEPKHIPFNRHTWPLTLTAVWNAGNNSAHRSCLHVVALDARHVELTMPYGGPMAMTYEEALAGLVQPDGSPVGRRVD